MPSLPLDSFCIGLACLIVGIRLGLLITFLASIALFLGACYTYAMPPFVGLMKRYPEVGLAPLVCLATIKLRPSIRRGYTRGRLNLLNHVDIRTLSPRSDNLPTIPSASTRRETTLHQGASIENQAAFEEEIWTTREKTSSHIVSYTAVEQEDPVSQQWAEPDVIRAGDFDEERHKSEPLVISDPSTLLLQYTRQEYKVAFELAVQDFVALRSAYEKLQNDHTKLQAEHANLQEKCAEVTEIAERQSQCIKDIKKEAVQMQQEMKKVQVQVPEVENVVVDRIASLFVWQHPPGSPPFVNVRSRSYD